MGFSETLRLIVEADTKGAVANVEKLGTTAEREASKAKTSLDKWGAGLTRVGAHAMAFGSVALVGLGMAVQSAGQLEQAVGGTEAVFGDATSTIDKYAKGAAQSAGLSETAFRTATTSIGGQLKRMGFDTDEAAEKAVELTQVAADLAATYGGTTAEAVEALGAAFRGEADPAERFNLDLKVSKVNAEAVALGLAETTSAVDDNAKSQALLSLVMKQSADAQGQFGRESDTLAGRQQRLSAEFENLKASIGEGAMPVFQTFVGVASDAVGVFQSADGATAGLVGKVAAFGSVGLIAAGGLSVVVGQVITMRQNLGALMGGVSSFTQKIGGLKGALIGGAGLAGAFFIASEVLEGFNRKKEEAEALAQRYADALGKEGEAQRDALDEITATDESLDSIRRTLRGADADVDVFQKAIESSNDELGDMQELLATAPRVQHLLEDALRDSAEGGSELAAELLKVAENGDAYGNSTRDLVARLLDQRDAFREGEEIALDYAHASGEAKGETDDLTGAVDEQGESLEETTSALEDYIDKLTGMTDPIFAAMDALTGQRDAQLAYRDAQAAVLVAQHELDEAIRNHGRNSTEAAEATRTLEDSKRDLADADWATVESAEEADSALAGLKDAVDKGDVSVGEFNSTLARWVRQGFLTQDQANRAAVAVGGLGTEAEEADRKRVDIPVTANTRTAHERFAAVERGLSALDGNSATVHVNVVLHDPSGVKMAALAGRRALGGPVSGGRLYEVAEGDKAELLEMGGHTYLIPGSDGTVSPSIAADTMPLPPALAGMGGGGGMSGTLRVQVEDNRTAVYLNDSEIASAVRRDNILNNGRGSVRFRG